jgi:hypothetical protein
LLYRYQKLLAWEYDKKLKAAKAQGKKRFDVNETVDGQTIDLHTSQSSMMMSRESSTPSISNSGFNFNDFVAESTSSIGDGRRGAISPELSETTPAKNLSPALARALAKKAKAAGLSSARSTEDGAPSPAALNQQSPRTPGLTSADQTDAHHGKVGTLNGDEELAVLSLIFLYHSCIRAGRLLGLGFKFRAARRLCL